MLNDRFLKVTGLSLGAFLVLWAANGDEFIAAFAGLPALVQAWTHALPLGVWSAILATVVATGAWSFTIHWLPPGKDGRRAEFGASVLAVLTGVAVTMTQAWGQDRGVLLSALWMGMAAGFLAPVIGQGCRSLFVATRPTP